MVLMDKNGEIRGKMWPREAVKIGLTGVLFNATMSMIQEIRVTFRIRYNVIDLSRFL